jgi:putative Mg2+ transporter-C (MgtC) family protein
MGLTTAASLWVVAGIGMAVGSGFIYGAVLTTVLVLVSLELLNRLENVLIRKRQLRVLHLDVVNEPGKLGEIASLIAQNGGAIRKVNIDEGEEEARYMGITFTIRLPDRVSVTELCEMMRRVKGVKSVRSE